MPGKNNQTETTTVHTQVSGFIRLFDTVTQELVGPPASPGESVGKTSVKKNFETVPVSAVTATFLANSIPTAQVAIPVGKSVSSDSSETVVKARELADKLKQFKNIEVWLRLGGEFAPGVNWPSKDFKVFNGYVTGTSTVRTASGLHVVAHCTHWLLDMDASMALTDSLVAGAPVAIRLPAVAGAFKSSKTPPVDKKLSSLNENLWIGALKSKFIEICNEGSILTKLQCGPKKLSGSQKFAARNDIALKRLQGGKSSGEFDISAVVDVPKLVWVEALDPVRKGAITQTIMSILSNGSLGTSTLWDKLLELANTFQFTIIPTVDSVICAPMSPCLAANDPPRHVTIKASEYHSFSPSSQVARVWKGISIQGQYTSDFSSLDSEKISALKFGVLLSDGCYIADGDKSLPKEFRDRAANGAMQFIEAPSWIQDISMRAIISARGTVQGNNPNNPMQGDEVMGPPAPTPLPGLKPELGKTLGDAFAKWWYWTHQFLPRTGEITGKLRFDIAPGSIVRIEDIDGKLYESSADFGYLYALVTSVRFKIDAVNSHASTSLTLSYIRRDSEKNYGIDQHPLYRDRWVGTVLQNLNMSGASASSSNPNSTFVPRPGKHERP